MEIKKYNEYLKTYSQIYLIPYGKDYSKILDIVKKYKPEDYEILDNQYLIIKNESLCDEVNLVCFKIEVNKDFNLSFLKSNRFPIKISELNLNLNDIQRVNHYMIKSNDSTQFIYGIFEQNDTINKYISICLDYLKQNNIEYNDRYCYITIDNKNIKGGESQRDFGWHIDGMQGNEVATKQLADYQFIWTDETPTKFCNQMFDIHDIDPSKHNVFKKLGRQVYGENCFIINKNTIYLMNPYLLHTATKSEKDIFRNFIRLSFTNTPITSIKMTVNKNIIYNYKIHQTTGNIPANLK